MMFDKELTDKEIKKLAQEANVYAESPEGEKKIRELIEKALRVTRGKLKKEKGCPNCGDKVVDDEYGEYCDAICKFQAREKKRRARKKV